MNSRRRVNSAVIPLRYLKTPTGYVVAADAGVVASEHRAHNRLGPGGNARCVGTETMRALVANNWSRVTITGGLTNRWTRGEPAGFSATACVLRSCVRPRQLHLIRLRYLRTANQREACRLGSTRGSQR